jgi:hypothetical protein
VVNLHAPAALPPENELQVPIGQEAEWAPERVWTTWRREKSYPYRDSNSDTSAVQPVASRYTECDIPALVIIIIIIIIQFNSILIY